MEGNSLRPPALKTSTPDEESDQSKYSEPPNDVRRCDPTQYPLEEDSTTESTAADIRDIVNTPRKAKKPSEDHKAYDDGAEQSELDRKEIEKMDGRCAEDAQQTDSQEEVISPAKGYESLKVVAKSPTGRFIKFNEELPGSCHNKKMWRAYDSFEGMEVAWCLVVLDEDQEKSKSCVEELRMLKALSHQNIVQYFCHWYHKETSQLIYITEILSGTLTELVHRMHVVRWRVVKRWMRSILNGLQYLHGRSPPVIHRDLKCDSIYTSSNNELRVGDFALARPRTSSHVALSCHGTPTYMAPEMYEENYNELVDIYSFGMCCLEMITKVKPYLECKNTAMLMFVKEREPPLVLNCILQKEAKSFIELCLLDCTERPSASALLENEFLAEGDAPYDDEEIQIDRTQADLSDRSQAEYADGLFDPETITGEQSSPSNVPIELVLPAIARQPEPDPPGPAATIQADAPSEISQQVQVPHQLEAPLPLPAQPCVPIIPQPSEVQPPAPPSQPSDAGHTSAPLLDDQLGNTERSASQERENTPTTPPPALLHRRVYSAERRLSCPDRCNSDSEKIVTEREIPRSQSYYSMSHQQAHHRSPCNHKGDTEERINISIVIKSEVPGTVREVNFDFCRGTDDVQQVAQEMMQVLELPETEVPMLVKDIESQLKAHQDVIDSQRPVEGSASFDSSTKRSEEAGQPSNEVDEPLSAVSEPHRSHQQQVVRDSEQHKRPGATVPADDERRPVQKPRILVGADNNTLSVVCSERHVDVQEPTGRGFAPDERLPEIGAEPVEVEQEEEEDVEAEIKKEEVEYQKKLARAEKAFETRLDNLKKAEQEKKDAHEALQKEHKKQVDDFEKRKKTIHANFEKEQQEMENAYRKEQQQIKLNRQNRPEESTMTEPPQQFISAAEAGRQTPLRSQSAMDPRLQAPHDPAVMGLSSSYSSQDIHQYMTPSLANADPPLSSSYSCQDMHQYLAPSLPNTDPPLTSSFSSQELHQYMTASLANTDPPHGQAGAGNPMYPPAMDVTRQILMTRQNSRTQLSSSEDFSVQVQKTGGD